MSVGIMRVPDLEYLIDEEEQKQEELERAIVAENYYYTVEYLKSASMPSVGLMNRRELHVMEKEVRKARELKKLKKIMGIS